MKKTTTRKKTVTKVKKPVKKSKVSVKKKAAAPKSKTPKIKSNGMNDFQQCVVLAAIINQQRDANPNFQSLPLPDVNSTLLAPLRQRLAQFAFTTSDIKKAVIDLLHSKEFTQAFPVKLSKNEEALVITEKETKAIMNQLLKLAGAESHKPIYLMENGPHDIHKTTLEKHALKTGQIDHHPIAVELHTRQDNQSAHQQILIKLNFSKTGRGFNDNSQRFSTKQRRGRG